MPSRLSFSNLRSRRTTLLFVLALLVLLALTIVARQWVEPAAAMRLWPGLANPAPPATSAGPRQSSPIALAPNDTTLLNVNPEANTVTISNVTGDTPLKVAEIAVGNDPSSVAIHPDGTNAYVANSVDGTVSVINLAGLNVSSTFAAGVEPMAVALSPNGTRLYVANSASNNVMVFNTATNAPVATIDLSASGTAPRAIGITNDGDADDTDETVFVALFYAQLRPGKTNIDEGQDDQREGRVAAISAATNTILGTAVLAPMAKTFNGNLGTGFNSNGQLAPGNGLTPAIASLNPQAFTTPTGAFPNQLASIAIQPGQTRAYVVSTGASPNGPLRFNQMAQGLVSVFDTGTRAEITSSQTAPSVRQTAPLNLNHGVNLGTTPAPRFFLTNPVAMTWRPDGSDAWIAVQQANLVVRLTVDGGGIPTVSNPLVAGPSMLTRVDLEAVPNDKIAGKAPQGLAVNSAGTRLYSFNFVSRSVSVVDISNPTSPSIAGTAQVSALPAPATAEATAHLGEELFFSGRGPQTRMSSEAWGSCAVCHPRGRSDNITWMFDAGPRQTIPLDGTFNKFPPHDQRILNWSGVRDEIQDFELNTRQVFGGRGLIDDDRLFLAISGASGATPTDSALVEQFQQFTAVVSTNNDFLPPPLPTPSPQLPPVLGARRDFAIATLSDDRVFIIGGRSGAGQGTLITGANTVLEFNPRTNTLTPRSDMGFTPRHSLGAAAVRTSQGFRIYAIGGYASTSATDPPVATVEEYNPTANTWRLVASLPTPTAQFGITVAGGINTNDPLQLIHVVSGNGSSEAAPSVIGGGSIVQRFQPDPVNPGTWSAFSVAGLTPRRNHGAAALLRGVAFRIFVIGGQDAGGTVIPTVEEYTNAAIPATVMTPHTDITSLGVVAPRARFGIGATLTTNQIYVMGGVDGAGADQTTVLEYSIANQGPVAGPPGTPSGAWANRGNLSLARRGLQVSTPPGVTNLLPVASAGRDTNQDALAAFVATIRSARAPVGSNDPSALAGQTLFNTTGLVIPGFSCATCHGGPRFTRSTVDYTAPPSPADNVGLGNQNVVGAELRKTSTQPGVFPGVLINVGTFTPNSAGGRVNEIRTNAADVGQAIAPLGATGFNIPSLLSINETAPYFYSGLAQTLDQVFDGSQDGNGGVRHHFVTNAADRANIIKYLRSIQVTFADLSITKTASVVSITPGGDITYTLTVTNNGPDGAENVVVTDNTPTNTTFQSFSQGSGPAAIVTTPGVNGTGPITITTATFAANATATYTITVKVNPGILPGTAISNTAEVTGTTQDPNPANNSATTTVAASPSISIANVTVTEGNSGSVSAIFTVTLSGASTQTVTVDYATADGTATAPVDYDSQAGTVTFPPGVTSRNINVAVKGDTIPEGNETFFVNLLNPVNGIISTSQGAGTINDDDSTNIFQFSSATASVNENAVPGSVTVTITRTGDLTGAASVKFETSDGSASQKTDYTFGYGTVQFNPGEASKDIKILIVNDALIEGAENFQVALSNPSANTAIGSPGIISVTINDDDAAPAPNPIDDTGFFVRQHYLDFLGRDADAPGFAFWTGQINACGLNLSCIAAKRVDVSASFFLSIEFQETGGYALRIQRVGFGRQSNDPITRYPYLPFMRDSRTIGQGVIVGQPGFDILLDQNKQAYAEQVVLTNEFTIRFPPMPAAVYVDGLFASAGVIPTAPERTAAITAFGAGGTTGRIAALRSVADSASVRTAESRISFVLAEYYGYLRRNPTDAPDFNDAGYQFWLNKLNFFNGNYIDAEMVKAFITSLEYRQRFGP